MIFPIVTLTFLYLYIYIYKERNERKEGRKEGRKEPALPYRSSRLIWSSRLLHVVCAELAIHPLVGGYIWRRSASAGRRRQLLCSAGLRWRTPRVQEGARWLAGFACGQARGLPEVRLPGLSCPGAARCPGDIGVARVSWSSGPRGKGTQGEEQAYTRPYPSCYAAPLQL